MPTVRGPRNAFVAVLLVLASACRPAASQAAPWAYRLAGGTARLQVRPSASYPWGSVCDAGFGQHEALVACRSLGFTDASAAMVLALPGLDAGADVLYMDDVQCGGSEPALSLCNFTFSTAAAVRHNCRSVEGVGVNCAFSTVAATTPVPSTAAPTLTPPTPRPTEFAAVRPWFSMPTFSECEALCQAKGGWLATILSSAEQVTAQRALRGKSAIIGANRFSIPVLWQWASGPERGLVFNHGPRWDAPKEGYHNWTGSASSRTASTTRRTLP